MSAIAGFEIGQDKNSQRENPDETERFQKDHERIRIIKLLKEEALFIESSCIVLKIRS